MKGLIDFEDIGDELIYEFGCLDFLLIPVLGGGWVVGEPSDNLKEQRETLEVFDEKCKEVGDPVENLEFL